MAWAPDFVDGVKLTAGQLNALNTSVKEWGGDVDTGGYAAKFETSAPTDADIPARGVVFWIDEVTHKLKLRVRYSNGVTLKSGEIALT